MQFLEEVVQTVGWISAFHTLIEQKLIPASKKDTLPQEISFWANMGSCGKLFLAAI